MSPHHADNWTINMVTEINLNNTGFKTGSNDFQVRVFAN